MSLTISSWIIADTRIQGVALRPVLGAYELVFSLHLTVNSENDYARRASIIGARVCVKVTGGNHALGFARPEGPFDILLKPSPSTMTPSLVLPLQPRQLAAIEDLRGASDLDFELMATGVGTDQNGAHQIQDTLRIHVPRSDWIKTLRQAKFRDILLLEVALPVGKRSKKWAEITSGLERAEEHFRNGDYTACVASCRMVIQELGYQKYENRDWAGPLLDRLASNRNGMTKSEREAALWGALRHYTHQAHHGGSEGGVAIYSRAEAQLVLILMASFVAHGQSG